MKINQHTHPTMPPQEEWGRRGYIRRTHSLMGRFSAHASSATECRDGFLCEWDAKLAQDAHTLARTWATATTSEKLSQELETTPLLTLPGLGAAALISSFLDGRTVTGLTQEVNCA